MSSISEAREALDEQMTEAGISDEAQALHRSMYDQIDALDEPGRRLFIHAALSKMKTQLETGEPLASTDVGIMNAVVSLAGYAVEKTREDKEETSTSDRRIDSIFDTLRDTIKAVLHDAVGSDRVAEVEAAAERVKARVAAGEDFETAAADEAEKVGLVHNHPVEAKSAKDQDEDRSAYGLYL